MERPLEAEAILTALKQFLANELLEGDDSGLEASTPLLKLGLINSMTVVMLGNFINERFSLNVRPEEMTPEHLKDLRSIADWVMAKRK